jgi:hypothetical protein
VLRTLIEHALAAGDVEFVACREAARRAREGSGVDRRTLAPVELPPGIYSESP